MVGKVKSQAVLRQGCGEGQGDSKESFGEFILSCMGHR